MRTETKVTLNDATIELLQQLIQANIDSRDGLRELTEKTDDEAVSSLFKELADERESQAMELADLVKANSETPEDDGSFKAAAHRVLIDLRAALGGGTEAMLSEAEKGEDRIKEMYEERLKEELATAVTDVLHRQYSAVKSAHDRVRDLRDGYKA